MSADPTAALARILNATEDEWMATEHERLTYRMLYLAALDQLHAAHLTIARRDEQLRDERAQLRRFAVGIFGEPQ